jgi:ribose transport system permease protein
LFINKNRLRGFIRSERFVEALPYFLVVMLFFIFTGLYPSFANIRNITGILTVSTVFLLVAAGETFPILMGGIDLSIGTMLSSSSIVAAYLFPYGGPWMILVAIAMGLISGIVNGSLIVALRLPSFIVTLAMMFAYRGIATSITSGYNINIRSRSFSWISTGEIIPGIPNIIIWGVIVFIIFLIISKRTKIGRYIYAIGGNEDAVKRMGINVNKYRIIAFAFSGLLNGVACVLLSSYLGMAPARLGDKYLFNGLTAVIVGGTSIFGGIGGLMRTLIGVLLIGVFDNGMNLIGVDSRGQDIAKGVLLIIAVSVTILSQKRGKIILTK